MRHRITKKVSPVVEANPTSIQGIGIPIALFVLLKSVEIGKTFK